MTSETIYPTGYCALCLKSKSDCTCFEDYFKLMEVKPTTMTLREQFEKEIAYMSYQPEEGRYKDAYIEWLESKLSQPLTDEEIEREANKKYSIKRIYLILAIIINILVLFQVQSSPGIN